MSAHRNMILVGDCRDRLAEVDRDIDLVITSPPYIWKRRYAVTECFPTCKAAAAFGSATAAEWRAAHGSPRLDFDPLPPVNVKRGWIGGVAPVGIWALWLGDGTTDRRLPGEGGPDALCYACEHEWGTAAAHPGSAMRHGKGANSEFAGREDKEDVNATMAQATRGDYPMSAKQASNAGSVESARPRGLAPV